jgi:Asp-tRNA(Asn)/Glu-tRNA(Gln) amidotransferase A subunit family amidase
MYHPEMSSDAQRPLPHAKSLETPGPLDATRRRFLTVSTAAGLGGTLFPGALLALATNASAAQSPKPSEAKPDFAAITPEMIEQAATIAGLTFTEEQRKLMIEGLTGVREDIVEIRKLNLPNSVAPSLIFDPVPGGTVLDTARKPIKLGPAPSIASLSASNEEQLAFASVRQLSELLRSRKVTSLELTRLYLARLRRYDPTLHFVITLTEDRALKQAAAADAELSTGKHRGPLHGIPWGGKDLLAVAGYPTTWGAAGFEDQRFDDDAEVVKRLDAAGAVLIAKLTMGALAQGDLWGYAAATGKRGARTRNPWNPKQGSSGSSAGSASAVSAGCVGFAIGTETLGSISSPSTRCGVTGLRPSFGLVPRTGAMALSWSMDKIGAITRSVEDCAIVVNAIYGPDGHDLSVQPAAFNPDFTPLTQTDIRKLRVGYIKSAFDAPKLTPPKPPAKPLTGKELDAYNQRIAQRKARLAMQTYDLKFNTAALETLRSIGVSLTPVTLPDFPFGSIVPMLEAEAAAAFDDLTRSGRDALLSGQAPYDWPNTFRTARLYSAVDYINAARARTLALQKMTETFAAFDVIVTPSEGPQLFATNLCGQPAVIVPNGLRGNDAPPFAPTADDEWPDYGGPNTPVSLTFLAPLYQDAKACALAHAYQQKTGFHLLHPKLG